MRHITLAMLLSGCAGGGSAEGTHPTGPGDDDDTQGETTDPGCSSWLATYDLTGSHFYIQATVDFTITVQEPYDADLNTGPGHVVLRFPDVDGEMGPGPVGFVEYSLMWDFVTGVAGFADVHTQIDNQAGPEPAGLTHGELAGGTLAWDPPQIEVCQEGQISCSGLFCGTSGAPPEGQPEIISGCAPWGINEFTFSPDLQTFDMLAAIVSSDADTETAMAFHGTLVEAVADPACP
jgi:hypothetical protein